MAVKLDMSKAYDRVEWRFLESIMQKMGFHHKWCNWIMECVRTVSFSFNINGEVKEYVTPTRGIRQGDPLSPYLFLLCSEGFSNLIRQAAASRKISGLKISRNGPSITHLFFADDSLIFCKATKDQAMELMRVLQEYALGSGQVINLEKSSILFSKNVRIQLKQEICQAMGNMQSVTQGKYLGLPMVVSRSKQQLFGYVKSNVQQRMSRWTNRLLSTAGKEILLKSIALAMPTYTMSCFKLPSRLCKELSSLLSNFWWGESNGKNKVHWCSWRKLTLSKNKGGLGFKDLMAFNVALLGKQVWRLITQPNLLISQVMRAKYFPRMSIFRCKVPNNASWLWRSLMGARGLVEQGTRRRIGNGNTTNIWDDGWIPGNRDGRVTTRTARDNGLQKVHELIHHKSWNSNLVFKHFNTLEAERILNIPISLAGKEDSHFWIYGTDGNYSVKSGYKLLVNCAEVSLNGNNTEGSTSWEDQTQKTWKDLWRLKVKHKLKVFLWKCLNDALPVKDLIYGRLKVGDPICNRCGEDRETIEHMLLNCRESKMIWKLAPVHWNGILEHHGSFRRWWLSILEAKHKTEGWLRISLSVNILWQIWKARNEMEFNGKEKQPSKIVQRAHQEWLELVELDTKECGMSTNETATLHAPIPQLHSAFGTLEVTVGATSTMNNHNMGIGIVIKQPDQRLHRGWALRARSSGSSLLDDANALKLAMCKIGSMPVRTHISEVQFQVQNPQLLSQIRTNSVGDIRLATVVDDIVHLRELFPLCSFCLIKKDKTQLSSKLSIHALGIIFDEEHWFP
ncbi:uncharacterized protein [Coffea arabica]|uniref:Reverse transcriptase domain-containing protein n=1 Tax=Coffea arabica TaxID=13443 RepID=A0A6P6X702_COFAR|nr:uncharacterized protein LOC113738631 [Coffea arabica]